MADKYTSTDEESAVQSFPALTFDGIMGGSALCSVRTSARLAFRLAAGGVIWNRGRVVVV